MSSSSSSSRAPSGPSTSSFRAIPAESSSRWPSPDAAEHPDALQQGPRAGNQGGCGGRRHARSAGRQGQGWTIEGRIPWTAFALTGAKPKPGDSWLFAICRYDYGPQGTEPVQMSSAPLTQLSFHRYEDYGTLRFEGPRAEK